MITTILLNIHNLTAEPQDWLQLWTFPSAVTKSLAVSSGLITAEPGGFFVSPDDFDTYPSTHIQYRDYRSFLANPSQASLSMQVRTCLPFSTPASEQKLDPSNRVSEASLKWRCLELTFSGTNHDLCALL